jgi:hypothetical protein
MQAGFEQLRPLREFCRLVRIAVPKLVKKINFQLLKLKKIAITSCPLYNNYIALPCSTCMNDQIIDHIVYCKVAKSTLLK